MKRFFSRGALGAILFVVLAGVGPGAVGDCGATTQPADAGEYCQARLLAICYRQDVAGMPMDANCADPARFCASQSPFTTCIPTDLQAEACVEAIYDLNNTFESIPTLPECDFCGGM